MSMRPILLLLAIIACARPVEKPSKEENVTIAEFSRAYVVSCQDICQIWGIKRVSLSSEKDKFYSTCECNDPHNIGVHKIKKIPVAMLKPQPVDNEPIQGSVNESLPRIIH